MLQTVNKSYGIVISNFDPIHIFVVQFLNYSELDLGEPCFVGRLLYTNCNEESLQDGVGEIYDDFCFGNYNPITEEELIEILNILEI